MPQAFANLEGLVRLSRKEGVDIRPSLVRVLTDLYVQEPSHTREEEQQYVELALRLLPVVDTQTRIAVANKLSAYRNVPALLRDQLRPILPELATADADRPEDPARPAIPNASDPQNARARSFAGQQPVPAPTPTMATTRLEVPSLGELFLRATAAERKALLARLEDEAAAAPDALAAPEGRPGSLDRLEAAALQRNQREFSRELQQSLGLSGRVAWQIVLDDFGEPLLIVARALGMPSEVLLRILLFLKPSIGESVERVFALIRLYDAITPQAAIPILASWREGARMASAKFQSVHAPDAAPSLGSARENARTPSDPSSEQAASRPVPDATARRHRTV